MYTLLDFYTDACSPCRALAPILDSVATDYVLDLQKINAEESLQVIKYNITSVPTLVLLKDGQEISRKQGFMPQSALQTWLDSHRVAHV